MDHQRVLRAAHFLLDHQDAIFRRERTYKLPATERLRGHLGAFLDGQLTGKLNVNQGNALDILSWRTVDGLNRLAAARPAAFKAALETLWRHPLDPTNADAFWHELAPALDELPRDLAKQFNGQGTRASVASYFLFIADPAQFPFYRPTFGGRAVEELYDIPLSRQSPGALLREYGERCQALKEQFNAAGLPVADMVDVQSALYVLVQDRLRRS